LPPVVIVPGDGSNQLEAKLNKPSTLHFYCSKTADWFRLWLDTTHLLAGTECWADNIKLVYDEERDTLSNNAGVETRVPDFGGTSAFEELDPAIPLHKTGAFYNMVKGLVAAGHVKRSTLRGAPYDFRYAPSSSVGAKFQSDLKELIEETVAAQGQRASIVSHSMGCLQTLYFLNHQTQEWKDKFIERWIPISGPYGGTAELMRLHASGNPEGLPVNPLTIREEQRSYETNFWMLPTPAVFGAQTLVSTQSRNYTAQDYAAFFDDIGFPAGKKLNERTARLTSALEAPGVDVLCLYSTGVPTGLTFKYGADFDKQPEILNGDGDGTVNEMSLKLCERWAETGAQKRPVRVQKFSNIAHSDMIIKSEVLSVVYKELGLPLSSDSASVVI
jgi:lysophospholipase-3